MKSNINSKTWLRSTNKAERDAQAAIRNVQQSAVSGENLFDVLMEACKCCSLGN